MNFKIVLAAVVILALVEIISVSQTSKTQKFPIRS